MNNCEPGAYCPGPYIDPGYLALCGLAILAILLLITAAFALIAATAGTSSLIRRLITRIRPTKEHPAMSTPPTPDELTGAFGTAHRIPEDSYRDTHPAGLDGWIITAPMWHPLWSQYNLGVVSLADFPGVAPARLQRPGVTHELTVTALNPDHGPYDARNLPTSGLQYLTPVNIGEQFTATDDQARQLGLLCARAVVDGVLCPETGDAPDRIRAAWRSSIHQTLQHDHDPHHGHLN